MLSFLLGIANYGVLLLFGVYVSAAFAEIRLNKKNTLILFAFSLASSILQAASYSIYGVEMTEKLYPLLSHLPLVLLFILVFKRRLLLSLFAVSSAYLCCQLSTWSGILTLTLTGNEELMFLSQILTRILMGILIVKYIASSITAILLKPQKTLLFFCLPPFTYYIFDYSTTVYTSLLYSGSALVLEFLPFAFCISYLIFCVIYFKEYEEKREAQQLNQLMEMQSIQSAKEIEAIRHSEREMARLRHDMRHFLTNIEALIQNDAGEQAVEYIHELVTAADRTTLRKYCKNNLVNTVLSYYENRMHENQITLSAKVEIAEMLPCSDTEFTSILSNGLENAMHAVKDLEEEKRIVTLNLWMSGTKMLLSIKNPYHTRPEIIDGLPVTDKKGHGIGSQSIRYVTEKLNGNCQFTVQDDLFVLRVVL